MPIPYLGCTLLPRIDGSVDYLPRWLGAIKPNNLIFLDDTFTMANRGFNNIIWKELPTETSLYYPMDGWGIPGPGRSVIENADSLVAMAQFSADVVKAEADKDSTVIYHGVNADKFTPVSQKEKQNLRKKYNLPEDATVLLYVGRNSARKLNTLLLQTVLRILKANPSVYFFGHIPNHQDPSHNLDDFIKHGASSRDGVDYSDVLDRIIFNPLANSLSMGVSDDLMPEYYQMADIYVTASSGEGFGFPIIEAMACEVPVVATDYTTTDELLRNSSGIDDKDKDRGFSIRVAGKWSGSFCVEHAIWDIDDAVEKITRLIETPELRAEMGKRGRQFVKANCDWDKIVDQWEMFFDEHQKVIKKPEDKA